MFEGGGVIGTSAIPTVLTFICCLDVINMRPIIKKSLHYHWNSWDCTQIPDVIASH